jgi:hypothetical protein
MWKLTATKPKGATERMTAKILSTLANKGYLIFFEPEDIVSKVRIITTWHFEKHNEHSDVRRTYKMAPYLVARNTEELTKDDFWLFYDALGQYPWRDDELDSLYRYASDNYFRHPLTATKPRKP